MSVLIEFLLTIDQFSFSFFFLIVGTESLIVFQMLWILFCRFSYTCIICGGTLAKEAVKPSKLKYHLHVEFSNIQLHIKCICNLHIMVIWRKNWHIFLASLPSNIMNSKMYKTMDNYIDVITLHQKCCLELKFCIGVSSVGAATIAKITCSRYSDYLNLYVICVFIFFK